LKLGPVLLTGAFAVPSIREFMLEKGVAWNDWATGKLFRRGHVAPTFRDSELTPIGKFPYNTYDADDPEVDLDAWTLKVSGLVGKPGRYTLAQVQALPKVSQNTRHVCIEGWDVVGNFAGARLADLLKLVEADTSARFVYVECADDYYESLDMPSALHPQSLVCYEMYGRPLERGHGAPLRLSLPTKIGYKSAKYLTSVAVTNVLQKRSYWADQGYSWYAGL